jgi:hypothetical protein
MRFCRGIIPGGALVAAFFLCFEVDKRLQFLIFRPTDAPAAPVYFGKRAGRGARVVKGDGL